jgi:putative transcriptional regulator
MSPFTALSKTVNWAMIRILLKQQLDKKAFAERRRITLKEVAEKTGLSRTTLNRIANIPGYNTNTDTIDALCKYFDCEIKDLVERVDAE